MSEKFSPTLRIGDLNDFTAPSQNCVVSLKKATFKNPDKPQKRSRECGYCFALTTIKSFSCCSFWALSASGWICYAEKQLGSYILPYISFVKSPQQTVGATIKLHLCHKLGFRSDEIYNVTVMPCYDKKFEASRDDFVFQVETQEETCQNEGLKITEVDSVLTAGEVLDLIQFKETHFKGLEESPLDRMFTNVDKE